MGIHIGIRLDKSTNVQSLTGFSVQWPERRVWPGAQTPTWFDDLPSMAAMRTPWPLLLWQAIAATWREWRRRSRARRDLAQIDERTLRDAGISPLAASYECERPFWRALGEVR